MVLHLGILQPLHPCLHRSYHLRRRMRHLHQVQQNVGALSRRQRGWLEVPSGHRRERQGIVLLSPYRSLPVYDHLRRQDALQRTSRAGSRLLAQLRRYKRIVALTRGHSGQDLRRLRHRIVVICNGVVIATLQRPHLRPSAIGKLCRQQIANSAQKAGAIRLPCGAWSRSRDLRQKMKLGVGRVIIQRADVVPVRVFWCVEVVRAEIL